jgi:hypothetical protein
VESNEPRIAAAQIPTGEQTRKKITSKSHPASDRKGRGLFCPALTVQTFFNDARKAFTEDGSGYVSLFSHNGNHIKDTISQQEISDICKAERKTSRRISPPPMGGHDDSLRNEAG